MQQFNELLDKMVAFKNPVRQLRALLEEGLLKDGEVYFRDAKAALQDRELAISHMIDFLGQEAAAQLGIPRIGVVLTHAIVPTPVSSPPLAPQLGPLNPFSWWVMTQVLSGLDRRANRFLRTLGGPSITVRRFCALSPTLNLLAASGKLAGVPDVALPAHVRCTGPWVLEEPEVALEPALLDFVARHPRPLIVSFGSMGGSRGPALTAMVREAITQMGIPAIIQSGYAQLGAADMPANVFQVGYLPHAQLFPLGGCILHHGGAGTTIAALRAGVPSAVVAFIADQPDFANRMHRLGVAPPYCWSHRLRTDRLVKMLTAAMSDSMYQQAQALRPAFVAEPGVGEAVRLIEGFLETNHRTA
jgi:sterol 3beta-glucosyltransferase